MIAWWGMERSHSAEPLTRRQLETLVDVADRALTAALTGGTAALMSPDAMPPALSEPRGVFVTLTVGGSLNGCIGTVDGCEPLAHAVTRLALAAAFGDPRLPALRVDQYDELTIEVSVLSPLVPVRVADRAGLLAALRPHVDGVSIRSGRRAGLFLPSVWSQLPDPEDFVDRLWDKAGLPRWAWPEELARFTTQHLARGAGGPQRVAARR